jgi:hypothetical protein
MWTRLRASFGGGTTTMTFPLSPIRAMPKASDREETPPEDKHGPQTHVQQSPDAQRLRLAGRLEEEVLDLQDAFDMPRCPPQRHVAQSPDPQRLRDASRLNDEVLDLPEVQQMPPMPRCKTFSEGTSVDEGLANASLRTMAATGSAPSSPLPARVLRPSSSRAAMPNLVPDTEPSSVESSQASASQSSPPRREASFGTHRAKLVGSRVRHIRGSTPPRELSSSALARPPTPQSDPALAKLNSSGSVSVRSGQSGHSIVELPTSPGLPRPKRYLE